MNERVDRFLLALLGAAMSLAPSTSHGQLAPTGGHYAARGSDTGHEPGGPNALGGYSTSVPLDLPPARGGLPIPLAVVYGSHGFGAAGVGWDVPLSYVRVETSFGHRRPAPLSDKAPMPRQRVVVSVGGRTLDMVQKGSDWVARRDSPELVLRKLNGSFMLFDGEGRTYRFVQDAKLAGTGLWLLDSISGQAGASVAVTYDIETPIFPGVPVPSIFVDVVRVSYNRHPTASCFKHEIHLVYDGLQVAPLSLSVVGERVLTRLHKLGRIDVTSRASCASSPEILRSYLFSYDIDPDTRQARLGSVKVKGHQGTPEASAALPIAAYTYGTAVSNGASGPNLRYENQNSPISLPADADTTLIATTVGDATVHSPIADQSLGSSTRQILTDVTGDGRPDLVFFKNNQLRVARNVAGPGGSTAFESSTPLSDGALSHGALEIRSSAFQRFQGDPSSGGSPNIDLVWRQALDVNGDGRIDIIDASEEPSHWVVYLNTPGAGPSGVTWVRRSILITPLAEHLGHRGLPVPSGYLPLARRVTAHGFSRWTCWIYDGNGWISHPEDLNHVANCVGDPGAIFGVTPEVTYTEWEVRDVNGDGYPDVVFNSSPVQFGSDRPTIPGNDGNSMLGQEAFRLAPAGGGNNRVDAVLNVRGIFISDDVAGPAYNPFSEPIPLVRFSPCGVEKWADEGSGNTESQGLRCGFFDVNGDGIADRVVDTAAFLGTGIQFATAQITLPGNLSVHRSGQPAICSPPISGNPLFTSRQANGLRDLTGDGIPDYFEQTGPTTWRVHVGTGAGFAAPIPTNGKTFSQEDETCDGLVSNTTGGLYDVDGDGRPEIVTLRNGKLIVSQLAGGSTAGTPEAGRLVGIDNGYGAMTQVSYRSAKEDASTPHQVPFPEIVVTAIQTTGTMGFGGTLAATRYAYGGAEMFYDSALDSFTMAAYRRAVTLRTDPDSRKGSIAEIVDTYPLAPFTTALSQNERFGRYLRVGRTSDVTVLGSGLPTDPWRLLTVDVTADARRMGGTHIDYDTRTSNEPPQPADNDLCLDIVLPYDFDLSALAWFGPSAYNVCSAHGFLFGLSVESWRGSAAPPSDSNVAVRTVVRSVDDLGRVQSVSYENDRFRSDDDLCVDTAYAEPVGPNERVLFAPTSVKLWDCEKPTGTATYAVDSFFYDGLPAGSVEAGRLTSHRVERHATDTGALVDVIHDLDVIYDGVGNPIEVVHLREDGASRLVAIDYDPFGLAPTHSLTLATGAPPLNAFVSRDPVTLDVLAIRDANGTERGSTFDVFGRPLLQTVRPPGGTVGALSSTSYLGFEGGDPLGRRVVTTEFTDPVDPAALAGAVGRTTTAYFDELGRRRFATRSLGADYGTESLVEGSRTYDAFGRVRFEADPYPASQDPTTAYGTTRYYSADGTPSCFVRGPGLQPSTNTADGPSERFPTVFAHSFANHVESISIRDAASLTAGSPQEGVAETVLSSAIRRALFRSTWKGATRLEHEAFAYDRLGQLVSMTRYQDASGESNPVQWSWRYDSLGQVLQLSEPASAVQTRSYSRWGDLTSITWSGAGEPIHIIANRYDGLSRLIHTEEQNGDVLDPATPNDFDYDLPKVVSPQVTPGHVLGRLAHAAAPTGDIFLGYDGLGRANQRVFTDKAGAVYIEQHSYRGDGSLQRLELDLPDNAYTPERVDYKYDSAGRPQSMTFSDGTTAQPLFKATAMDPFGRLRSAIFGSTHYAANYANTGRRLLEKVDLSTPLGARTIGFERYDAMNREVARTETAPGAGQETTSYDALGRVASAIRTIGATTTRKWSFQYDPLGNLLLLTDHVGARDAALSYLATDRDRICRIGYGNGGQAAGPCNVAYDSFGNISLEPTRTGFHLLSYFNSGSVRKIFDSSAAQALFRYDPFGRVQELDITNGADLRSDRRYGDFIFQRDEVAGGVKNRYVSREFPGPGLTISRRGPRGPWIFAFAEKLGTRVTTDESGAFLQDVGYEPYGEAASSGAPPGSNLYSSEQWNGGDALSPFGLDGLGARLYDPVIGRFLSRDPFLLPRSASTTNPYGFARNDPRNRSDPSGLDSCGPYDPCIVAGNGTDTATAAAQGAMWADISFVSAGYGLRVVPPTPSNHVAAPIFHTAFMTQFDDLRTASMRESAEDAMDVVFGQLGSLQAISGALQGACDFIACDQETGGGDTLLDDGHGGRRPDSHIPHRVTYLQQAKNIFLNDLGGRVFGHVLGGKGIVNKEQLVEEPIERCAGVLCGNSANDPICFTAGTTVATESGTVPIEDIRPGDRVRSLDPSQCTEPISADSCRRVEIEMENPYGYRDRLRAEFLRSEAWVSAHEVYTGAEVPLVIDELAIRGSARVVGIYPCMLEEGSGCLVTGTMTHVNRSVLRLHFAGSDIVLEPTALHPLWSLDRDTWVRAGELEVGERLLSESGVVAVASIEHLEGARQVFNFEVAGSHTYLVSDLRIQSHNGCNTTVVFEPVEGLERQQALFDEALSGEKGGEIQRDLVKIARNPESVGREAGWGKPWGKRVKFYDWGRLNWDYDPVKNVVIIRSWLVWR